MPRILVIEDDNSIRLGLVDTLRAKGYEVIATGRAEAGLAAAREQAPDLIILDVMLPDGDGFDVCRQLKAARSAVALQDVRVLPLMFDVALRMNPKLYRTFFTSFRRMQFLTVAAVEPKRSVDFMLKSLDLAKKEKRQITDWSVREEADTPRKRDLCRP